MKYQSTRAKAPVLGFEETILTALASDGGLYVPERYPHFSDDRIASFAQMSYQQIALEVILPFVEGEIAEGELAEIIERAYGSFSDKEITPLVEIGERRYLLELFHGPTLAFKDVAMQLLAPLMERALLRKHARSTIIGATSGDTGGAAIRAFGGLENCDMVIFYPHGKVSDVQRKQMTTAGFDNVHVVALEGSFDDCQGCVKELFANAAFRKKHNLGGINSINWGRIMAQIVYYFYAGSRLNAPAQKLIFSVPTGNFGDIFAGFAAMKMGLPVERLVIASNSNDILPRALALGKYVPQKVVHTMSPSMDIQISSNFERLLYECSERCPQTTAAWMAGFAESGVFSIAPDVLAEISKTFSAFSIDEKQTLAAIKELYQHKEIILDPHSAVGFAASQKIAGASTTPIVSLATADAAKFPKAVKKALGFVPDIPPRLQKCLEKKEKEKVLPNDMAAIMGYMEEVLG